MGGSRRAQPRILLVDDDEHLLCVLSKTLQSAGFEVRAESHGRTIDNVVAEFHPDLAILDVRLPGGPDGYAIARRLRSYSDMPILFLTVADSHDARIAGYQAGADDYLGKPFEIDELLWHVRALLRRAGRATSPVREVGDLLIDDQERAAFRGGKRLDLTRTEYALLSVFMEHPRRVLSKQELLDIAWGSEAYDTNIVEVYVSSLRRKLERHGPRLIHTVRGRGYVLRM